MTAETGSALYVALAYHRAWTSHDFERAMTYVAPDIVCLAPAGRILGADAFRAFMGPFSQILTRSELLSAFGDRDTVPVQNAPAAELLTVRDGRITQMRIIFDRAPFDAARRAAGTG
jgi:hypothetical protein